MKNVYEIAGDNTDRRTLACHEHPADDASVASGCSSAMQMKNVYAIAGDNTDRRTIACHSVASGCSSTMQMKNVYAIAGDNTDRRTIACHERPADDVTKCVSRWSSASSIPPFKIQCTKGVGSPDFECFEVCYPNLIGGGGDLTDDGQRALRLLRSNPELAGLADSKVMRTLLLSHSLVASRITSAKTTAQIRDIFLKAMKTAGLASLIHTDFLRQQGNAGVSAQNVQASSGSKPSDSCVGGSSGAESARPTGGRWARRSQQTADDSDSRGWTVVTHKKASTEVKLVDEWSVSVCDAPKLNSACVCYTDDIARATEWVSIMKDNPFASAIVSRKVLDLPGGLQGERIAFHTAKDSNRSSEQQTMTVACVGFIYQLHASHCVTLRKSAQTTTLQSQQSTVVIRVLAHEKYTPASVWDTLSKGRAGEFKTGLTKALAAHAEEIPAHMLYDVWKVQKSGKIISAVMRIHTDCIQECLKVSGQTWLFTQPVAGMCAEYPVIWEGSPLPESLGAMQQRCDHVDGLGIALSERRLGIRVLASEEPHVRVMLDKPKQVAWRMSGLPLQ
eukprot:273768-Amphidinium_carterae.2